MRWTLYGVHAQRAWLSRSRRSPFEAMPKALVHAKRETAESGDVAAPRRSFWSRCWWCLDDEREASDAGQSSMMARPALNVRVRRVRLHTKLHHRLQHACVERRTLGPLKLAKANYLANVSKCDPRHANDLGPEHPSPIPRCTAVRTRADSRGGSTPRALQESVTWHEVSE